jgi:hypothetical protein
MGTRWAAAVALAVGAFVAGCGGSGGDEPSSYALAPTRQCLVAEQGFEVNRNVDFVATTALGGAIRVRVSATNFVVMAFGNDETEAQRIEQAYRDFAGRSIPIDDVLQRQKNVVLVWNAGPSAEEEGAVTGCLKGAG